MCCSPGVHFKTLSDSSTMLPDARSLQQNIELLGAKTKADVLGNSGLECDMRCWILWCFWREKGIERGVFRIITCPPLSNATSV
jgi:hypothetical protein